MQSSRNKQTWSLQHIIYIAYYYIIMICHYNYKIFCTLYILYNYTTCTLLLNCNYVSSDQTANPKPMNPLFLCAANKNKQKCVAYLLSYTSSHSNQSKIQFLLSCHCRFSSRTGNTGGLSRSKMPSWHKKPLHSVFS